MIAKPRGTTKSKAKAEFGDFQTPTALALAVAQLLHKLEIRPATILEPTCGIGAFLAAAARTFPEATSIIGVEINPSHVDQAHKALGPLDPRVRVIQGDFFTTDWNALLSKHPRPCLILGNPPWATISHLSALESSNLPSKSNFHGRTGIEALTGKSNFDISEWMLFRYLDWLQDDGTIAVLCKTSVARKLLLHAWKGHRLNSCAIYKIDAMAHFDAAVDACLFVMSLAPKSPSSLCPIYESLNSETPIETLSLYNGYLVSNCSSRLDALWGASPNYVWRSGIKHDCSRVMELSRNGESLTNGLGEKLQLEDSHLYPMLKGSDIGNGRTRPRGLMIVTQKTVGEPTAHLAKTAPGTWNYLNHHADSLRRRGSVIYRNNPDFSIFGVGPYTFAPWKVAVSSFYKKLLFVAIGPVDSRPVVFDDTVYFVPCETEEEARFLAEILHSPLAADFLNSFIQWSDKRPVTIDILKRLNLNKLAALLGREAELSRFAAIGGINLERSGQLSFGEEPGWVLKTDFPEVALT